MKSPLHVCLGRLEISTCDQIEVIGEHLKKAGIDFCYIGFPSNTFTMTSINFDHHRNSVKCNTLSDLEKTYACHSSAMLVLQSPYPEHYPVWLLDSSTKINFAYAGYALPLINWENGHFQTQIIKRSKYLLAANKYEYNGYRKNVGREAEVHIVGNSILYEIRKKIREDRVNDSEKTTTLWAPHWSKTWFEARSGFSRFELILPSMLQFFSERSDQNLIFRPHPILREALFNTSQSSISRESQFIVDRMNIFQFREELERLLSLPNVKLSQSSMLGDVMTSHQLVTDGVSMISYWASTGKPMCIVMDDLTPKFNNIGKKLTKKIKKAATPKQLNEWLSNVPQANKMLARKSNKIHPTFSQEPILEFLSKSKV
jgi:hypothetical protein